MKKLSAIVMAAALLSLTSLQAYGQGHSAARSNRGGQLRGDARSDQVHDLNAAKKKGKKSKKAHKYFAFHHNDKGKGKGKGNKK